MFSTHTWLSYSAVCYIHLYIHLVKHTVSFTVVCTKSRVRVQLARIELCFTSENMHITEPKSFLVPCRQKLICKLFVHALITLCTWCVVFQKVAPKLPVKVKSVECDVCKMLVGYVDKFVEKNTSEVHVTFVCVCVCVCVSVCLSVSVCVFGN